MKPVGVKNLSQIQERIQAQSQKIIKAADAINRHAEEVANLLYIQIKNYQASLSDTDDVALLITNFGQSRIINVDGIGYIGNNLIRFLSKDTNNKPQELIQHVSQLNFLMCSVPIAKDVPARRQIGFVRDETDI